jgi:sigma-E factor negative regulatory protein RseB
MRGVRLAACLLGWAAATAVVAQPAPAIDPAAVLLKAADAARTGNYRGTVIYRAGGNMESMRLIHGYADGVERERLVALTGEPREIIRIDNKVTCLLPKDRKLDLKRPAVKGLLTNVSVQSLRELAAWYELKDAGVARVAGRACRGVLLAPRDGYRYGYEIWADEATGVPLKVALTGPGRLPLEEMMFTEVDFPAGLSDDAFAPGLDPSRFKAITRAEPAMKELDGGAADLADFPLRFEHLPPGYRITLREQRPGNELRGKVEHLMLSDGLAAVSVFAALGVAPEKGLEGLTQMGAVQAYGRRLGRYHVTVVGETPVVTVEAIAAGLVLGEPAAKP